jgi:hypothetical protein
METILTWRYVGVNPSDLNPISITSSIILGWWK